MLELIKQEANRAYTENGALSHATTCSDCLDLFAAIGGLRNAEKQDIISRFQRAFAEDPDLAMKLLFFARDIRGGLGERRVVRICLQWLAGWAPGSVEKNLALIPFFGRWDDVLTLLDTPCEAAALSLIRQQLDADRTALAQNGEVSLLAKWLPSVNASNPTTVSRAKRIARFLGMDDRTYRKCLVSLRQRIRIIENDLRRKDYSFDYAQQPARAMHKYRKAFLRNDRQRYEAYLARVAAGEAVLHTNTLAPYEIIAPVLKSNLDDAQRRSIDITWNAQADFTGGENALAVIDGSGSMYTRQDPMPAAVALSLGIYFAERNTGAFANHFITFSEKPRLVQIKGRDICEKVAYCAGFNEVANTNIQRVFDLILKTAVRSKAAQEQMPDTLYIISDMEFDVCTQDAELTNFEYAKQRFARAGYQLPRVVFWNVASRTGQQPVTMNEQGVALVSGCSPRVFDMLSTGRLSPMAYMLDILGSQRYQEVTA